MKILITILSIAIWTTQSIAEEIKLNCQWKEVISNERFIVDDGVRGDLEPLPLDDFFLSVTPEGCATATSKRWGTVQLTEKWIKCQFLTERTNFEKRDTGSTSLDKWLRIIEIDRFTGKATEYIESRREGTTTQSLVFNNAGIPLIIDGKFKKRNHAPQEFNLYKFSNIKFQCNLAKKLF